MSILGSKIDVTCPNCDNSLRVNRSLMGRGVECAQCGEFISIAAVEESDGESTTKKRRRWPFFIVVTVLVLTIAFDAHARFSYVRSFSAVRVKLEESNESEALTVEQAEFELAGYPRKSSKQVGMQQVVDYRWRGLIREYTMRLILGDGNEITAIESDVDPSKDRPPMDMAKIREEMLKKSSSYKDAQKRSEWLESNGKIDVPGLSNVDGTQTVTLSNDGKYLAVSYKENVHVFETHELKPVSVLPIRASKPRKLAFLREKNHLAIVTQFRPIVYIWDFKVGRVRGQLDHDGSPVTFVAFSPAGDAIATVSGGTIGSQELLGQHEPPKLTIWDPDNFQRQDSIELNMINVTNLVYSSDGTTLAISSGSFMEQDSQFVGRVEMWDTTTNSFQDVFENDSGLCHAVAFAPIQRYLAIAEAVDDSTSRIRLVSQGTGRVVREFEVLQANVSGLAFTPNEKYLVASTSEPSIMFFDVEHDTVRTMRSDSKSDGNVSSLAIQKDIIAASYADTVTTLSVQRIEDFTEVE